MEMDRKCVWKRGVKKSQSSSYPRTLVSLSFASSWLVLPWWTPDPEVSNAASRLLSSACFSACWDLDCRSWIWAGREIEDRRGRDKWKERNGKRMSDHIQQCICAHSILCGRAYMHVCVVSAKVLHTKLHLYAKYSSRSTLLGHTFSIRKVVFRLLQLPVEAFRFVLQLCQFMEC